MKKLLTSLLLIFITLNVHAQSFEGKLIYNTIYKSKVQGTSDEQLLELFGTKQEYFIKGGNYYSRMNGTFFQWQLYVPKENKYYLKIGNTDKVYWIDGAVNKDEAKLIAHNRGVSEILGHKCDELIFQDSQGTHKYYFSSDYPMDSKLFVNHKYGNWYAYLSKANALPLKEVVDSKEFYLESTAIEVSAEKLNDKLFTLPEGVEIAPSPF